MTSQSRWRVSTGIHYIVGGEGERQGEGGKGSRSRGRGGTKMY